MFKGLQTNVGIVHVDSLKYKHIKRFIELLEKYEIESIKEVILFGSAARGECTEDSDIDICIITTEGYNLNKNKNYINFYFEYVDVEDYCETDILMFESRKQLEFFSKKHLYNVGQEILKDGKTIYLSSF